MEQTVIVSEALVCAVVVSKAPWQGQDGQITKKENIVLGSSGTSPVRSLPLFSPYFLMEPQACHQAKSMDFI